MVYKSYQSFKLSPMWILIAVNFLVFIATTIAPALMEHLALKPTALPTSPWTIVTSLFVHSNLWHIAANMFTLYFFGRYVSRLIGERKLLIVYLGGGILGSILYILSGSYIPVVGASGAVFSLGGVLAVMRPKLKVFVFPIPVPIPLWIAVIGGFFILASFPRVALAAHLGGLVFGLATGYLFRKRERYFF